MSKSQGERRQKGGRIFLMLGCILMGLVGGGRLQGADTVAAPSEAPPEAPVETDVFRIGGVGLRILDQPKPKPRIDQPPAQKPAVPPPELGEEEAIAEGERNRKLEAKKAEAGQATTPESAAGGEAKATGFFAPARDMIESVLLARPKPRATKETGNGTSPAAPPENGMPPVPPAAATDRPKPVPSVTVFNTLPPPSPPPPVSPSGLPMNQEMAKRSATTPRPPMTTGDGYVIQPGDVLSIKVMNEDNLAMGARVGKEGTINFPYVDDLQVRGMTVEQVSRLLQERLSAFFVNPVVIVQIAEFSARQFSILGQIASPGVYSIPSFQGSLDLVEVIAMAGGPGSPGAGRFSDIGMITIKRFVNGKEVVVPVDGRAIGRNQAGTSVRILPGDSIFVQLMDKQFTVMGQVKSPGRFEIPAMRDYVTVLDAIAMAGGPTRLGDMGRVVIKRMEGDEEQRYSVNAKEMGVVENSPQFRIRPGDTVTIRERIF